jgi:spore coat protein CotF
MITNVSLTTKEQYLLQDQKSHEQQCVLKYDNYANLASDAQLKSIFTTLGQKEKEHLQTINQLLNGQIPNITSQGGSSSQSQNQLLWPCQVNLLCSNLQVTLLI